MFSRLTASVRARSRAWGARHKSIPDYPGKTYEGLRAEVKGAVEDHEPLKAEMLAQTAMLDRCLRRQEGLAVEAVREGQDEKAAGLLYRKLLVSRQINLLRSKLDGMSADLVQLDKLLSRLKLKIQAFRDERNALKTRHLPPEDAVMRLGEATAGLDEELTAVRYALDRTKAKAAEASISCENARRLAAGCTLPADGKIPDQDLEPVARALNRLKAEMMHYDCPHPQR